MNKLNISILMVIIILFFQGCLPKWEDLKDLNLENEILKEMENDKIPSLTYGIIKDNKIVWMKAYGKANREKDIDATTKTLYPLMSVSKLAIVTATMQLVEQGLLDLDTDVNNYLPFSVRNSHPEFSNHIITPRMLLTHSSGIINPPAAWENFPYDSAPPLKEWLAEYFTQNNSFNLWLNSAPGEIYRYSNTGSALMAYMVEVISKTDYNEYCKQYIFQPLDMPVTSHRFSDLNEDDVAYPYNNNYWPYQFHYTRRDYPAGWLKSSVEEFSHFLIAYINGGEYQGKRILKTSTVDKILTIQNPANGQCLIWHCYFGRWFGHNGGDDAGYTTRVEIQREDKLGIIILTNSAATDNPSIFPGGRIYGLIRTKANEYR